MIKVDESICGRCGAANPESAEQLLPCDWEVLTDRDENPQMVICGGCLTGAEQASIDRDFMALDSDK